MAEVVSIALVSVTGTDLPKIGKCIAEKLAIDRVFDELTSDGPPEVS